MRKWRLDELPQFLNVLRGDMSLVGPRPERQFYVDQLVGEAPLYKHIHKVKPGITSLGMVQFGYAENVSEMIERMKYDLLYIENMSIAIGLYCAVGAMCMATTILVGSSLRNRYLSFEEVLPDG